MVIKVATETVSVDGTSLRNKVNLGKILFFFLLNRSLQRSRMNFHSFCCGSFSSVLPRRRPLPRANQTPVTEKSVINHGPPLNFSCTLCKTIFCLLHHCQNYTAAAEGSDARHSRDADLSRPPAPRGVRKVTVRFVTAPLVSPGRETGGG